MRYEATLPARFTTELVEGVEQLRIPAARSWFALPFLIFWILAWSAGGVAAMVALARDPNFFLMFWLCGWALGWLFAASSIAWQLGGAEALSVIGGDLHYRVAMPGYSRLRVYRGADVQDIAPAASPFAAFTMMRGVYPPLFNLAQFGSVRFRYGGRAVYLAPGLDDAESAAVVEWLRRRLGRSGKQ